MNRSMNRRRAGGIFNTVPPVFFIIIFMVVVFASFSPDVLQFSNWQNILVQSISLMLVALAQTMVILTEGVDLSLGSQVSLVTVVWVLFMQSGIPFYIAAVMAIAISMISGAINGIIISKWRIPPFIATLGMQGILYSAALLVTKGSSIYYAEDIFQVISGTEILFFPLSVWITVLLFLLTWVILYKTKLGAQIFGLGGNPEALVLAGVNTVRPTVMVYAYAGFLTAMSGLLTTCRLESGQPIVGQGWEFEAVAATILGGTAFREGKGGIAGTIFGVLFITILKNGLNLVHLSAIYMNAVIGVAILGAIVIDTGIRRINVKQGGQS